MAAWSSVLPVSFRASNAISERNQLTLDAADRIIAVLSRSDGNSAPEGIAYPEPAPNFCFDALFCTEPVPASAESAQATRGNAAGSRIVYTRINDQKEAGASPLLEVAGEPMPQGSPCPGAGGGTTHGRRRGTLRPAGARLTPRVRLRGSRRSEGWLSVPIYGCSCD